MPHLAANSRNMQAICATCAVVVPLAGAGPQRDDFRPEGEARELAPFELLLTREAATRASPSVLYKVFEDKTFTFMENDETDFQVKLCCNHAK